MGYNQYNLRERSIYNLFSKYDKNIIDLILDSFKKETTASNLLRKQFGASFDGTNITFINTLNYLETSTLQGILTRFESRLKVAKYLSNSYTDSEIYNMFLSKTDVEISNMVKNILKEKENITIKDYFNNIDQIIKHYNISIDELKELIEKIQDNKAKKLLKIVYLEKEPNIDVICTKVDIKISEYNPVMENAKRYLYSFLEEQPDKSQKETSKQPIKIVKKEEKTLDKEQYIKKQQELLAKTSSTVSKPSNIEKKESTSSTRYVSFYDYFMNSYNNEQKIEAKKIIKELIDKNDDPAIPIIIKMYTDTLSSRTDYVPSVSENLLVIDYRKKVKSYLVEYFKSNLNRLKPSFYDYFIESYMTESQKEKTKKIVNEKITDIKTVDKEMVYKVYGQDLESLKEETTAREAKIIRYAVKNIKNLLEKEKKLNQIKSSFYDYFIYDNMTSREVRQLKEKVKELLPNIPNNDIVKKIYTTSLEQYTEYKPTEEENVIFNNIKKQIKLELKKSSYVKEFKASFYDYFMEPYITKEEEKNVKKQIDLALLTISKKHLKFIYSLYGESLTELQVYNLEEGQKDKLKEIISKIKNKIDIKPKKVKNVPQPKEIKPKKEISKKRELFNNLKIDSFYDYFINKETKEDKTSIKKTVKNYLEMSKSKSKDLVYKKFNQDLTVKNEVELSVDERTDLRNYINNIKSYIKNNSTAVLHNNIYDYIIGQDSLDPKKEELRRYITYLEDEKKYIIFKIYGRGLNEHNLFILTPEEKHDLKKIVASIRKSFKPNYAALKLSTSFYDYFIDDKLSVEERIKINDKVLYYFTHSEDSEVKKLVTKIYGENLDQFNPIELSSEDYKRVKIFIHNINKKIEANFTYQEKKPLIDRYYKEDEIYNRKIELLIFRYIYLSSSNKKDNFLKLYGPLLNEYNKDIITPEEKRQCKISLQNPLYNHLHKTINMYSNLNFLSAFCIRQRCIIDEEKIISIIKEYISSLDNNKQKLLYKVFGINLDTINDIKLNDKEKMTLFSIYRDLYLLVYKEYNPVTEQEKTKVYKKNQQKVHETVLPTKEIDINEEKTLSTKYKSSYYDYFITDDMNDNDKRIRTLKIRLYINRMHHKNIEIIQKVYGSNYDKYNDIELTNKEQLLFNRTIQLVNNYIRRSDIEKKIEYFPNTFYDYFIDDSMTDEEKNIIKTKVKYYYDCTDNLAKETVRKIYTDSLDYYVPNILDKHELIALKRYIKSIKQYIIEKQKRKSNTFIYKSFYDYFMEKEDEKLKTKIDDYMSTTRSKMKEVIIKIYGENYDTLTDYRPTKQEKSDLKSFIKVMKKSFSNNVKKKKSFYDYFDCDKEIVKTKLKDQPSNYIEIITKMYGSDYEQKTAYKASPLEYYYLRQLINKIKESKNGNKLKRFAYNLPSFYDYFPYYQDDESKELIKTYNKYSESRGKKAVEKIYDDNFIYNNKTLDSNEKNSFRSYIVCIKGYLAKTKKNNHDSIDTQKEQERKAKIQKQKIKKNSFYDFFIDSNMKEEEKERIKTNVKQYVESSKQSLKDIVIKAYGPDYDLYNGYVYTKEEKRVFHYYIQNIKRKKLSSEKTKSTFKIDIYKIIPNAHLIMNNDLIDINIVEELLNNGGIVDLYNEVNDSYKLQELLGISSSSLISIYLEYLPEFQDISEIIKYIVINSNDNSIIHNILSSNIFNKKYGNLTDKEKEVIYLKLLQLKDDTITDEVISKITGININDIINYQIITKDDRINSLNKILIKEK